MISRPIVFLFYKTQQLYRGKTVEWQYGTRLTDLGGTTFAYDGLGRRIKKGNVEFTYDNGGKLLKQSNGLQFVYDNSGVVSVIYGGEPLARVAAVFSLN